MRLFFVRKIIEIQITNVIFKMNELKKYKMNKEIFKFDFKIYNSIDELDEKMLIY